MPKWIIVEYEPTQKPSPSPDELTLTGRLLTPGRKPDTELPDSAVVADGLSGEPVAAETEPEQM